MVTPTGLPPGTKLCPGWTSEYPPDKPAVAKCGEDSYGRRKAHQQVINDGSDMCSRCHRQKAKWDEENGARLKQAREQNARVDSIIELYADDVRATIPAGGKFPDTAAFLAAVVTAIDTLKPRGRYAPHAKEGTEGYYRYGLGDKVMAADKLNILRKLAGLPLRYPHDPVTGRQNYDG